MRDHPHLEVIVSFLLALGFLFYLVNVTRRFVPRIYAVWREIVLIYRSLSDKTPAADALRNAAALRSLKQVCGASADFGRCLMRLPS